MPITPAEQLAAQLREQIRTGRLRAGDQLPRDRDLVARYRVSHSTVARAIDALRAEGLVAGRVGSGRHVLEHEPPRRDRRAGADTAPHTGADRSIEPADRTTAAALGVDDGAPVEVHTWLETSAGGQPIALRATRGAATQAIDAVATRIEEIVSARLATPDEAMALWIDQTIPVLVTRRTRYDATGRVIALDDTIAASTRLELLYELPT